MELAAPARLDRRRAPRGFIRTYRPGNWKDKRSADRYDREQIVVRGIVRAGRAD
jgi:hypothetical protein